MTSCKKYDFVFNVDTWHSDSLYGMLPSVSVQTPLYMQ